MNSLIFTIATYGIGVIVLAVFFYKMGYRHAKKNVMIHAFKEKMISPDQYATLDKTDI